MENQEKQDLLIKGKFTKNRVANIMLIAAPVLFIGALLFSSYAFNNLERYFSIGWGYGGTWYYSIGYDDNFMNYFLGEFWSLSLMYGYILILSIIIFVAALIMKQATEKASLSLTKSTLTGNSGNGTKVNILVKDIQKVIPASNGISVYTVSGITKFPLLQNRDEVLKAFNSLSILLWEIMSRVMRKRTIAIFQKL